MHFVHLLSLAEFTIAPETSVTSGPAGCNLPALRSASSHARQVKAAALRRSTLSTWPKMPQKAIRTNTCWQSGAFVALPAAAVSAVRFACAQC